MPRGSLPLSTDQWNGRAPARAFSRSLYAVLTVAALRRRVPIAILPTTVSFRFSAFVKPFASVIVTATTEDPADVGVPLRLAVPSNVSHAGAPATDHL